MKAHLQFPHFLQGETTWYTDHQALTGLKTSLANSPRRVRWRETLDQFPFTVKYKPGKEMHVDGLTRHSSWPDSVGDTDPLLASWRFDDFTEVPFKTLSSASKLAWEFWKNYVGSNATKLKRSRRAYGGTEAYQALASRAPSNRPLRQGIGFVPATT